MDIPSNPEDVPQSSRTLAPCGIIPTSQDIPGHPGTTLRPMWNNPQNITGWSYCTCPMSQVSQDIPGHPKMVPHGATVRVLCVKCPRTCGHPRMVPHGATVRVLCLKCPRTCGHPRTSRMVPHGATLRVLCLKCPSTWWTSQDIPGMVPHRATLCPMSEVSQDMGTSQDILHGDGPTWGYPMCPMSQVSQDMGTSGDGPTWGYSVSYV